MKLFVGNIANEATENELKNMFSQAGEVVNVTIITDAFSGRSRGFAFVEMVSDAVGLQAIEQYNGVSFMGKTLIVNQSHLRKS